MLSNVKTDHRDLLRSHVWGCPTFVLDPKLQNDQKIPKWNKRSRLGQFLGYSDEHSSLVANVRHLKTGNVSSQYHCVFDDLFQTVHSADDEDNIVDAITDSLWDNARELYALDEFDKDGMLVYEPPPLDEVWLDEPARRDRKNRLDRQRRRVVERDKAVEQQIVEKGPPTGPTHRRSRSPPSLVTADDSSDDSSTVAVQESEGELWADHPSVVINPPPNAVINDPIPPAPNIVEPDAPEGAVVPDAESVTPRNQSPPREREPQWERDEEGRLKRRSMNFASMNEQRLNQVKSNMSMKDKQVYAASLCAKAPPKACRLSRKKLKHRQRMAKRREIGDSMLNAMHFGTESKNITVDELMNSHLAKFIELAANDCGYAGSTKELICNWVHPLFLKAKSAASKEDNPTWWQAMSGPFADEYWKAAVTEIETLEGMDAWDVVDKTDDMNVIDSTWAFKLKRFPDGLIKKFKGRFCARGDQQIEGVDYFETYAPVVQWTTVRLMLILEVLLGLKSKQGDVTAAFLHADLGKDEEVYVRMPRGFEKKGKVLKLKKTLYGLRQSPRAFWRYMLR